jgi:hypothetical protein
MESHGCKSATVECSDARVTKVVRVAKTERSVSVVNRKGYRGRRERMRREGYQAVEKEQARGWRCAERWPKNFSLIGCCAECLVEYRERH